MTLIHLCLIVCMLEPVCLCARMFGGYGHLLVPVASGGEPDDRGLFKYLCTRRRAPKYHITPFTGGAMRG